MVRLATAGPARDYDAPLGDGLDRGIDGRGHVNGGRRVNVNGMERALSLAAGGALAVYGLRRKDMFGLALGVLGGALVERGASGHCQVYNALGITTADDVALRPTRGDAAEGRPAQLHGRSASVDAHKATRVKESFTIYGRTAREVYDYWRNLENLPRIFRHLKDVRNLDETRSRWVAKAPAGRTVEWDAQIINDVPGELLAWRSLDGADVPNAGSVRFREAPGGRGTEVRVALEYEPPLGKLGVVVAKLFGEEPSIQVREDLRRYKQLLEAGEIPVSENPGTGERARAGFDAQVNRGETGGNVQALQTDAVDTAHQAVHQAVPSDQARGANSTEMPKAGRL